MYKTRHSASTSKSQAQSQPARQHAHGLSSTLLGNLAQLSMLDLIAQARTETQAERAWIGFRWPHGVKCPRPGCGSTSARERRSHTRRKKSSVTFVCRGCGQPFTVRTHYVMEESPLGFRTWLWAAYLVAATIAHGAAVYPSLLSRRLGVTHKTAGDILQRIDPHHHYRAAT